MTPSPTGGWSDANNRVDPTVRLPGGSQKAPHFQNPPDIIPREYSGLQRGRYSGGYAGWGRGFSINCSGGQTCERFECDSRTQPSVVRSQAVLSPIGASGDRPRCGFDSPRIHPGGYFNLRKSTGRPHKSVVTRCVGRNKWLVFGEWWRISAWVFFFFVCY